jgi:hypothetical protein
MPANETVMQPSNLGPTRNPYNYERIEQIARDVTTAWLSPEEVQNQLNLFGDDSQSAYLGPLELAVRMAIEDYLGMSLTSVSYRCYYSANSLYGIPVALDLPTPLIASPTIDRVAYYSGQTPPVANTVDPSQYFFDPSGNRVVINTLPTELNMYVTNPIWVDYTLDADPIALYPVVRHAGLLLLTHLYNNRDNTTVKDLKTIPWGIDVLLRPYKKLVM